uniref:Hypoxia inducible factor 1 subunit alpha, like n=1 Tax=Lepisosteus oculatus TaxID=7918 RepID=W5NAL7_LEPOC
MDTDSVEKFFAVRKDDDAKPTAAKEGYEALDLDMLAPYISMDDDFQLTFLAQLPESEPPTLEPAAPGARKRTLKMDEDLPLKESSPDKRKRQEEVLLHDVLLGSLVDGDSTDELEQLRLAKSLLNTDDPLVGGERGLCNSAALMSDLLSRPPDPLTHELEAGPISPLT